MCMPFFFLIFFLNVFIHSPGVPVVEEGMLCGGVGWDLGRMAMVDPCIIGYICWVVYIHHLLQSATAADLP